MNGWRIMASSSDCLKAIDAAAKGELSDAELEELIETLDRIRKERGAAGDLEGLEKALFDEAGRIINDTDLAAKIEKRNRLQNIVILGRGIELGKTAQRQFGDASLALEACQLESIRP